MKRLATALIAALCLAGVIAALTPADALCDVIDTVVRCQSLAS